MSADRLLAMFSCVHFQAGHVRAADAYDCKLQSAMVKVRGGGDVHLGLGPVAGCGSSIVRLPFVGQQNAHVCLSAVH